jgi:hypothetical protein
MKHYTAKQINEMKQEIRTGKPVAIIADELALIWGRPVKGVYNKVLRLAKLTRKITNTYNGPTKKPRAVKAPRPAIVMNFDPLEGSLFSNYEKRVEEIIEDIKSTKAQAVVQEICEEIIDVRKPVETVQPAEIGIEVPSDLISLNIYPTRVVVYSDHVRYYFKNN